MEGKVSEVGHGLQLTGVSITDELEENADLATALTGWCAVTVAVNALVRPFLAN